MIINNDETDKTSAVYKKNLLYSKSWKRCLAIYFIRRIYFKIPIYSTCYRQSFDIKNLDVENKTYQDVKTEAYGD